MMKSKGRAGSAGQGTLCIKTRRIRLPLGLRACKLSSPTKIKHVVDDLGEAIALDICRDSLRGVQQNDRVPSGEMRWLSPCPARTTGVSGTFSSGGSLVTNRTRTCRSSSIAGGRLYKGGGRDAQALGCRKHFLDAALCKAAAHASRTQKYGPYFYWRQA